MEWDLVLKYIANYPVILSNLSKCVNDSSRKVKFNSNKVSRINLKISVIQQVHNIWYTCIHVSKFGMLVVVWGGGWEVN